jgi:CRISPR-associated exonuclease Cas4
MGYLLVALAVVAGMALWGLRRSACSVSRHRGDAAWLPDELRDAHLVWSEKSFQCLGPIPMAVRIDRAYRAHDGKLNLVEFKHREARRAYRSDVVELSVQRYVLQKAGHEVNQRAHVVVVPPGGGRARALPVELEDAQGVERRAARLMAVVTGNAPPNGPAHTAVCRGCGHRAACPRKPK